MSPSSKRAIYQTWAPRLVLAACGALFLFHLLVIWKNAVNVPFYDDWGQFSGENHPASLSLGWLHRQANEHRIALTKVSVWLQYHLNGWNVAVNLLIDFILYGLLLAFVLRLAREAAPRGLWWVAAAFVIFPLSPLLWFDHLIVTASAIHFYLLFFFAASYLLFGERQGWPDLCAGCAAAILSIYSFGAGVVACFILLMAFSFFKVTRAHSAGRGVGRRRELLQLALAVALVGGALASWTIGYVHPARHQQLVFPDDLRFWVFFLNYVSTGFGIDKLSAGWGAVCLLIVVTPVCGIIWERRGKLSGAQRAVVVAVMGLLGVLASIALGRAGFPIGAAKGHQYAEHPIMLLPLTVLNWAVFLDGRGRLQACLLAGLWVFCLATFLGNWDFGVYAAEAARRREGVACIKAYYEGRGEPLCPTVYPREMRTLLDNARKANASTYRSLDIGGG